MSNLSSPSKDTPLNIPDSLSDIEELKDMQKIVHLHFEILTLEDSRDQKLKSKVAIAMLDEMKNYIK